MKLTSYLNKIEAKYVLAREEWESIQRQLKEEEEHFQNTRWTDYSQSGKQSLFAEHQKKKAELLKKLDEVRAKFTDSVKAIETDSDKVFDKTHKFDSGDVDTNGVMILQNSSMSNDELIDFAESYRKKNNYTMYFMIAEKLKQDKKIEQLNDSEKRAMAYYNESKERRRTRDDHEILEGFRDICLSALRNEDYLSNGIHRNHEEFYNNFKTASDQITSDIASPWED